MSYDAILTIVVSLGVYISLRSARIDYEDKIDDYTSTITLVYFGNLLLLVVFIILFGGLISSFTGFSISVLFLLALYSFSSGVITLYNVRVSLDYDYKKYILIALINSVGNIGLSLLLILTVFPGARAFGRIIGAVSVSLLVAIIILAGFYKKAKPRFEKQYLRYALRYSLPIVPHGISQVLLAQFDRIMISNMIGNAAAGIYSLAANIKLILTVITDSVTNAWATWFFEQIVENNVKNIQKRAKQIYMLFTIMTIGLLSMSPEMILILGGAKYANGKYVAIPMIMDAFVLVIYNLVVQIEYYKKKTHFIMIGTVLAAILNVITNYIFIKRFGYIAAAYTTLFSYLCYLLLHLIISAKLAGFHILQFRYIALFGAAVVAVGAFDLAMSEMMWIRWAFGLVFIIPMTVILARETEIAEFLSYRKNSL